MTRLYTLDELKTFVSPEILAYSLSTVKAEGGYVDDPDDKGGPTNDGVSLTWANSNSETFDLNHDGRVDRNDIKLITLEIPKRAFVQSFFLDANLGVLLDGIKRNAFDTCVNAGPGKPIKLAQHAVNHLHLKSHAHLRKVLEPLNDDNVLDAVTLVAI